MTPRRNRADERRAMFTFAHTHGIPFAVGPSHFMPGALQYTIGEGPTRRIAHSPARAWKALRAAAHALATPPRRKVPARLRAAVLGIKIVP